MNNTRFATLLHILTILGKSPQQWLSSEWIAGSIQINPVIVRKELGALQQLGWVSSRKGKEGGYRLVVPMDGINLADIYKVVKKSDLLGKKNLHVNPKCPIGKDFNQELDKLITQTDALMIGELQQRSLETFVKQFD